MLMKLISMSMAKDKDYWKANSINSNSAVDGTKSMSKMINFNYNQKVMTVSVSRV